MAEPEIAAQWRPTLVELAQRLSWNLSNEQLDAYLSNLARLGLPPPLQPYCEQVLRYFHHDHPIMLALRDEEHADHQRAWAWVSEEIQRVARIKGLLWSGDRSVERTDLVQLVQAEVVRSLGEYRFESSLRTWLQSVTIRRLSRFHRDSGAAKRAVQLAPLEAVEQRPVDDDVEHQALASALVADVAHTLSTAKDKRMLQLFQLSMLADRSAEEIGERLQLHPSRVRALLKVLRELLASDERVAQWRSSADLRASPEPQLQQRYT
jgi:RNA polymerase sigma factor (sigma-70 family)